jgi:hypothetical protein
MKTIFGRLGILGILFSISGHLIAADSPRQTKPASEQIGIYDSRAVAYAHFWSPDYQRNLREQIEAAKAAKAAGDTQQFKKLNQGLADQQQRLHGLVFSVAPANEALAALQKRIPELQRQANVSVLISKWDQQSLAQHATAERADVTDLLVREFNPTEKQLKTIEQIKAQKPVPLDQIEKHRD